MFKKLLGKTGTSKTDVLMAVAMAITGVWKAVDTFKEYKADQETKELES